MDGRDVGRRIGGGRSRGRRASEQGFTFVEILVALSISVVALLANLFLVNNANQNLALARSLTDATNLATNKIASFNAKTITQITAESPTILTPCPANVSPLSTNPLNRHSGWEYAWAADDAAHTGVRFKVSWVMSSIDLDHHGTPANECDDSPNMCSDLLDIGSCDVVNLDVEVTWTLANRSHSVTMATFVTGIAS